MIVLVTGITGQLGYRLAADVLRRGHTAVGVVRNLTVRRRADLQERFGRDLALNSSDLAARLALLEGDIVAPEFWRTPEYENWLESVDFVVHCAGDIQLTNRGFGETFETNVDGTRHVGELVLSTGRARLVHISTAYVCGAVSGVVREDAAQASTKFNNYYEMSKAYAERSLLKAFAHDRDRLAILRPSVLCGAYNDGAGCEDQGVTKFTRLIGRLSRPASSAQRTRILGNPNSRTNIVPIDLAVEAMLALIDRNACWNEVVHVASPCPTTNQQWLDITCEELGVGAAEFSADTGTRFENWHRSYGAYLNQDVTIDTTRLSDLLAGANPLAAFDAELHIRRVCRYLTGRDVHRALGTTPTHGRPPPAAGLDEESRLVLALLREDDGASIDASGIDWNYLFALTESHKLSSTVWHLFTSTDSPPAVPERAKRKFVDRFASDERANAVHKTLLGDIEALGRRTTGPLVFLKGVVLKHCVYPKASLRPMNDVDVLVREADIPAVREELEALGFSMTKPFWPTLDEQRRYFYELPTFADSTGRRIDVHWNFTGVGSPYHRDVSCFFETAQRVCVAGREVATLDPEHFLLHLSVHLFTSSKLSFTLRDLYDIHLAANRGVGRAVDAERFSDIAVRLGLEDPAYFCCRLANHALAGDVTWDIGQRLGRLAQPHVRDDVRQAMDHFHFLMRPAPTYLGHLEDAFAEYVGDDRSGLVGAKFFTLVRRVFDLRPKDFERMYFEPVVDPVDTAFMYPLHLVKLLQYYHLGLGDEFINMLRSNVLEKAKNRDGV